ncbi:uncharacterized protein MELLADRAFT_112691 [Melampsora larici-populina 98AG31]|uniref:Uncharacterized protein n=1 Tax=Melampsora larici-populina (strain 98AG31 / pathotype 3-4-7) TaxID=747676 RepID=F4S7A2_MELLP|nr:uncharacterized protein MELLADRAFT_112691 [Melampsora larici-populina 98AG31]EGF99511.1 hypothetical protein MELLADRAFT_112691 [Melampsora larici-populina 98AG31]
MNLKLDKEISRRVNQTSDNSSFLQLTHRKWVDNLRLAALNSNLIQFNLLNQEYEKWCIKYDTDQWEIELHDLDFSANSSNQSVGTLSGAMRNVRGGYKGNFFDPNYQRNRQNNQHMSNNQNYFANSNFNNQHRNMNNHPYHNYHGERGNYAGGRGNHFNNFNGNGSGRGGFMNQNGNFANQGGSFSNQNNERPVIGYGSFNKNMAVRSNSQNKPSGPPAASGSK